MTEEPLRGILYGHGHMGRYHAAKLAMRPDIELMVIDPNAGMSAVPFPNPDFAIVATPTTTHAKVAQPLLANGVPCLVEKPLARTLEEAQELAQYQHLSVGHIERFNPVFEAVNEVHSEYIEIERLSPFSDRSTDVDVLDDLMIHDLDLLARFMPGKLLDVRAKGVGVMSNKPDIVHARLEIELPGERTGVVNLTASRVSPKSVRTWRLVEAGRYWSLDLLNQKAKVVDWANKTMNSQNIDVPTKDALTAEHTAFLQSVRYRTPFPCTGTEALKALQLAERIRACLH